MTARATLETADQRWNGCIALVPFQGAPPSPRQGADDSANTTPIIYGASSDQGCSAASLPECTGVSPRRLPPIRPPLRGFLAKFSFYFLCQSQTSRAVAARRFAA